MSTYNVIAPRSRSSSNHNTSWCIVKQALIASVSRRLKRMTKHTGSSRTFDCDLTDHGIADDMPELPSVLWTDEIFFYLDRTSQNRLAQAHPDVAKMRRKHAIVVGIDWPCGKIKKKVSLPVNKVEFSPDSQQLCVVHHYKSQVMIYDKFLGLQHVVTAHPSGAVADARFSPDGSILATASQSDTIIRLWKRSDNSLPKTNEKKGSNPYSCSQILKVQQVGLTLLKWSPNAKNVLCSFSQDGLVRVSDIDEGMMYTSHWKTRRDVSVCRETVAFGPGDIVAYARNNEEVHLWNWKDGTIRILRELNDARGGQYPGSYITGVAYSPNGTTLAVGCQVATIKLWTLTKKGRENDANEYDYTFSKEILLGGWSSVTLLTFTPDGNFLACSNNGSQIRIVDLTDGQIVATFDGHKARIDSLCFTSDGRTLASGGRDRRIRLWDTSRLCCGGVRLQQAIQ
jgi:WD40 repeat protein